MTVKLDKHTLDNGLVILGERMENVRSAAFNFKIPCGEAYIPAGCCGAGSILVDWLFRGAGDMNSRELIDNLDGLGLHRSSSISTINIDFGSALEAGNLLRALELYADIILRPKFDAEQFQLGRQLAVQELVGLDDEPRQKVMLNLRQQFFPAPFGKNTMGILDDLKALTPQKTAEIYRKNLDLSNTIFSVAGNYDFKSLCEHLENLFSEPNKAQIPAIEPGERGKLYSHENYDGAQTHIGLMTASVPIADENYYNSVAVSSILGGGMSARLFTEVREKRGLCYAVGAKYHAMKNYGAIACYAGTVPEKSQETLDVIISEFRKLSDGITDDELQRTKVGLKSSVIMSGESSSSRAGGIGSDYYLLGRVRSLDEIKEKVEQITVDSVVGFLETNKFEEFTISTIGPGELEVRSEKVENGI